jgi:hypothetical protein
MHSHKKGTKYVTRIIKRLIDGTYIGNSHDYIGGGEMCTLNKAINPGDEFGISTVVYAKKGISAQWIATKISQSQCGGVTYMVKENLTKAKGTLEMTISNRKNPKQKIFLTCSHFPFNKPSDISNFLNDIIRKTVGWDCISFGDLNSRSALIPSMKEFKSIPLCSSQATKGTVSDSAPKQSKLDFNQTEFPRYCEIVKILENIRYADTVGETQSEHMDLITTLLKTDILNKIMAETKFREHGISFLPTYKRSMMKKDMGNFELFKRSDSDPNKIKAGRYPGYADRILFTDGCLKCDTYTSLDITGNDHLPVYANFTWNYNACGTEKIYGEKHYKEIYEHLKNIVWLRYLDRPFKTLKSDSVKTDEKMLSYLSKYANNDYNLHDQRYLSEHGYGEPEKILEDIRTHLSKNGFNDRPLPSSPPNNNDNDGPLPPDPPSNNNRNSVSSLEWNHNGIRISESNAGGGKRKTKRRRQLRRKTRRGKKSKRY